MVNHYGVREQTQSPTALDVHVERIRTLGFTVVETTISDEELQQWRGALDRLIEEQTEQAGGREALAAIGEADTVRALLSRDASFLTAATNEAVLAIARVLLGDYFTLIQQNGLVNRPSGGRHHQSAYHRDLPYQHFVASRPIAINALLCLDPFEVETGCTLVLPGSHKMEPFPSNAYVEQMEQPVTARPGSYLVCDCMLYHRAGYNRSNQLRRAVNHAYALPIIQPQIALPALLRGRWSEDPFLAGLLGYKSDPPRSIEEYLARRTARATE